MDALELGWGEDPREAELELIYPTAVSRSLARVQDSSLGMTGPKRFSLEGKARWAPDSIRAPVCLTQLQPNARRERVKQRAIPGRVRNKQPEKRDHLFLYFKS